MILFENIQFVKIKQISQFFILFLLYDETMCYKNGFIASISNM